MAKLTSMYWIVAANEQGFVSVPDFEKQMLKIYSKPK